MRVVISVDMEGASGIGSAKERSGQGLLWEEGRRYLTADCNAVIGGALDAGATRIVLHDSHGFDYNNIIYHDLDPKAELVRGLPIFFFEDLRAEFDACFIVAAHAGPHRVNAFASHLYSGQLFQEVRINGQPVGEGEVTAAMAGALGIPTALVTGDDVVCADMSAAIPGLETAVVKTSLSRFAARCLPLSKTQEILRSAARRALETLGERRPFTYQGPLTLEVACSSPYQARVYAAMGKGTWDGTRTVRYQAEDIWDIYRFLTLGLYLLTSPLIPMF